MKKLIVLLSLSLIILSCSPFNGMKFDAQYVDLPLRIQGTYLAPDKAFRLEVLSSSKVKITYYDFDGKAFTLNENSSAISTEALPFDGKLDNLKFNYEWKADDYVVKKGTDKLLAGTLGDGKEIKEIKVRNIYIQAELKTFSDMITRGELSYNDVFKLKLKKI